MVRGWKARSALHIAADAHPCTAQHPCAAELYRLSCAEAGPMYCSSMAVIPTLVTG